MKPIVLAAVVIITLALVFYSVATGALQRSQRITNVVALFLTLGVTFDLAATLCMVVAAGYVRPTVHGALGITALLGMLVEVTMAWQHRLRFGPEIPVSSGKRLYALIAYAYWVIAFVSGGTMVVMSRRAARQAAQLLL